jgi:hypothetical protein
MVTPGIDSCISTPGFYILYTYIPSRIKLVGGNGSSIAKIYLGEKTPFKNRHNLHISLEYVLIILVSFSFLNSNFFKNVFKIFCPLPSLEPTVF